MADFSALKTAIQANIRTNGNEEITGAILQDILLSMVTTMGDGAINALSEALQAEITNRQNAVSGEATTRAEADSQLSGRINSEAQTRGEADTQLSNSITAITTRLNEGYVYAGIATPSTNPGTPAGKVFYIALQAGAYTNFSSLAVTQGINILKYNGTAWSQEQLVGIDDEPTIGSNNLVKSGGVFKELADDEIAIKAQECDGLEPLLADYDNLRRGNWYAQSFDVTYTWRVASKGDVVIPETMPLFVEEGFRVYFFKKENDSYTGLGWKTNGYIVESGTYHVIIARVTEDQTEVADFVEFASKVSYDRTRYSKESILMQQNYVYFSGPAKPTFSISGNNIVVTLPESGTVLSILNKNGLVKSYTINENLSYTIDRAGGRLLVNLDDDNIATAIFVQNSRTSTDDVNKKCILLLSYSQYSCDGLLAPYWYQYLGTNGDNIYLIPAANSSQMYPNIDLKKSKIDLGENPILVIGSKKVALGEVHNDSSAYRNITIPNTSSACIFLVNKYTYTFRVIEWRSAKSDNELVMGIFRPNMSTQEVFFDFPFKIYVNGDRPTQYNEANATARSYFGERIKINPKFIVKSEESINTPNGLYQMQGCDAYGDLFIGIYREAEGRTLRGYASSISTGQKYNDFELPNGDTAHANSVFFGNTIFEGYQYPLLYVNGYTDKTLYGYKVIENNGVFSLQLITTISLSSDITSSIVGLGPGDFNFDYDTDQLIYTGHTENTWDVGTGNNTTPVAIFSFEESLTSEVELGLTELIDKYIIEPTIAAQDKCYNGGNLFILKGLAGTSEVDVLNLISHSIESRIPMYKVSATTEYEGCFIHDGYLYIHNGYGGASKLRFN